ncbi:MAG: DUF6636 domain-containing protein [Hyphomicrobiales bacterium]
MSAALLVACGSAHASGEFIYFKTPSGNIQCSWYDIDGPEVRCDIRNFTSSLQRPADCDLDWGYAFAVGANSGKGAALCAGDTVASPEAEILEYGRTFSQGGLSCVSETKGLTCKNGKGHGFSLSRAKQRVF